MWNSRRFEVTNGFGCSRIAVVEARNCNGHERSPMLLSDNIAIKIQADIYRFSTSHSGATPDTLVVLFQAAKAGEALRLDARLGLTFGEAVRSGDGRPGIVSAV